MSFSLKSQAKNQSSPQAVAPSTAPAKKTAKTPAKNTVKRTSKPTDMALPQNSPRQIPPATFFPTLLPSLLVESSPELCWEWKSGDERVAARLTQFGWNASAYAAGSAVGHWHADSLDELRSAFLLSVLPPAFVKSLAAPWVLAYDVAGFE